MTHPTNTLIAEFYAAADAIDARLAPSACATIASHNWIVLDDFGPLTSTLTPEGNATQADGHAERKAALDMVHRHSPGSTRRLTLGADKGYDAGGFVADLRKACVTPHLVIFRSSGTPLGESQENHGNKRHHISLQWVFFDRAGA